MNRAVSHDAARYAANGNVCAYVGVINLSRTNARWQQKYRGTSAGGAGHMDDDSYPLYQAQQTQSILSLAIAWLL